MFHLHTKKCSRFVEICSNSKEKYSDIHLNYFFFNAIWLFLWLILNYSVFTIRFTMCSGLFLWYFWDSHTTFQVPCIYRLRSMCSFGCIAAAAVCCHWPRSRALKPSLIRFFFHPKQYFSLTNSSSIPPAFLQTIQIPPSEQAHGE